MENLKVAAASLNQTALGWDENQKHIVEAIRNAKGDNVDVLCLPELCLSGYTCGCEFKGKKVSQEALHRLKGIATETDGILVTIGLPINLNGHVYNACAVLADKKILGIVPKISLERNNVYDETQSFEPWPEKDFLLNVEIDGKSCVIGQQCFKYKGHEVVVQIGHDDKNIPSFTSKEHNILLNPSADYFTIDKIDRILKNLEKKSAKLGASCVYANLLGTEDGQGIFDGSTLIAQDGNLKSYGKRFSYRDFILTSCGAGSSVKPQVEPWDQKDNLSRDKEEFSRATALALFDYQRKSHSHGYALSLSGGADSAACACIVALAVKFGQEELGTELLLNKLARLDIAECVQGLTDSEKICRAITKNLLSCVYQGTENNSNTTLNAARELANGLGAKFTVVDIDSLVKKYKILFSEACGEKVTWEKNGTSLQNIQARVRAPGIWFLANVKGYLLLATGNASEATLGYTTMDGDTVGCLAPLGGIDKPFIREWLRWLEKVGVNDTGRIASLKLVNEQQPTAELKPIGLAQTDEKDLMPYPVQNDLHKLLVLNHCTINEAVEALAEKYNESKETLRTWVERFDKLMKINAWKRSRLAPSLVVSDDWLPLELPRLLGDRGFDYGGHDAERITIVSDRRRELSPTV